MTILTPELRQAVEAAGSAPVTLTDPESHRSYVLLPLDAYEKLVGAEYDDSPWTEDERDALADEARRSLDGGVESS